MADLPRAQLDGRTVRHLDHQGAIGGETHRPSGSGGLPHDLLAYRLAGGHVFVTGPVVRPGRQKRHQRSSPALGDALPLLRAWVVFQERSDPVRWVRPMDIQTHPGDDGAVDRLDEDSTHLAARANDVVRPLQRHRRTQDPPSGDTGD